MYSLERPSLILARCETWEEAARLLMAYTATAPGREDELVFQELNAEGDRIGPQLDIFDIA